MSAKSQLLLSRGVGSDKQFSSFPFVREALRFDAYFLPVLAALAEKTPHVYIYIYLQTASNIEIHVLPEELHLQHNAIYFALEQPSCSAAAGARGWHKEQHHAT